MVAVTIIAVTLLFGLGSISPLLLTDDTDEVVELDQ
jgi:hypothetical protein